MIDTRKLFAALLAAGSLAAAGCGTDDAIERDVRDATEDIRREGEEAREDVEDAVEDAGREAEEAVPGDSDGDGK